MSIMTESPTSATARHQLELRRRDASQRLLDIAARKRKLAEDERTAIIDITRARLLSATKMAALLGISRGPVDAVITTARAMGELPPATRQR